MSITHPFNLCPMTVADQQQATVVQSTAGGWFSRRFAGHRSWHLILALALLLTATCLLSAQIPPRVEVVADLLETFNPASVHDSLECAVRRPAIAGGVKENGLFEHPLNTAGPARVDYDIELPSALPGERLLLAFEIALSDGVKLGTGEDGVRFVVELDGHQLFAQVAHECRWSSHAVDLTVFGGRRVRLALLTDGLRNTSYDWALWGNPRVLHFGKGAAAGPVTLPVKVGALAVNYTPGRNLKIRLQPVGGGEALEWQAPTPSTASGANQWFVTDFSFPAATGVELTFTPKDALAPGSAWLGAFPPQARLIRISAARAVPFAGELVPLRVEIKNEGRGELTAGEARVQVQVGNDRLSQLVLPALPPGERWHGDWQWPAPARAGRWPVKAELIIAGGHAPEQTAAVFETFALPREGRTQALENSQLKIEFVRAAAGYAYARIFGRQDGQWTQVGVWRPFFRILLETRQGEKDWEIRPQRFHKLPRDARGQTAEFVERLNDADGVSWTVSLRVVLEPDQPVARLHYEWQAAQPREIKALWGPNVYIGDGTTGAAKTWGLFPGLEYLYGAEPSSNPRDFSPSLADRRTPNPTKITVPLMAVTVGPDSQSAPSKAERFFTPDSLKDAKPRASATRPSAIRHPHSDLTVALLWEPLQKWDGEHQQPSPRFASPNFDEGMQNHRVALFLPSTPDFVPENADHAEKRYHLDPNRAVTLDANLVVTTGPILAAMKEWYREIDGLPRPNPWPRSFEEELAVCRAGFLHTVWDEKTEKWRHCIGWAGTEAPGFATLLWIDARITHDADGARRSRERVDRAAKNMLSEGGPSLFTSPAACHILRWEFPFYFGYLPEALASLTGQIQNLIQSQQTNGGWSYEPGNAQQADLGQPGDSVLGTCAPRASTLSRYARITGDRAALDAAEKALRFMETFRVPRGGQTWECPMYEPDILAAAYAIAAYTDAFEATGNPRWLHDAVYWAEAGTPFLYQWTLSNRPMMLGATIPVFGSTFYTHTWLAVPVQWCGLVYAYHVFHLAEVLERTILPDASGSPLPLALNFSPTDWKRVVELIAVSGMNQQFADGERIGAYPDSISDFTRRNGVFINPEDILVNVLLLQGTDPDIKTARVKRGDKQLVISSGARVDETRVTPDGVHFRLRSFKNESSHSLVSGLQPTDVRVDGQPLTRSRAPLHREAGWWWDEKTARLYLTVPHNQEAVEVEIIGRD
ncbi:MAG: hypothetical protein ACYDH9_07865 [Limisphaerales bacterium]